MQNRLMTKEQLIALYRGKFVKTYPWPMADRDSMGKWITKYEVLACSRVVKEGFESPEDI